ncbi:single-stranded-DNA-specific exonuclease RecJ [Macrococcoides caseolyticum]|uniref:single-stranded-DNA-specific exonuclease RecJ n=1 Tax=Macrococcoides caseolyticum TaxID=69966 RepID=UPI001F392598|nr:single-stranded-DNA-specific exonuclease RecJ [Macrococcus caseolyticus]MCE4956207.1 single-stranded-DNA-specific exonuclease RecJ [Macrococcus caseolyticus]
MVMIKKQWQVSKMENTIPEDLIKKYKISKINQKILSSRNMISEEQLKDIFTDGVIHDPYLLSDMDKAVMRIKTAINNQEPILVYGDYDADGVTSVTVLVKTLESLGAIVGFYIPNRFTEGYGPNSDAFRQASEEGVALIITVDNGIQGHNEIQLANELGMDVIITDHHEIGETLPEAFAIIHPMHPEFNYPFKCLAGVGVAYKLSHALLGKANEQYLPFVAIGTISDLVSMTGENRAFVKKGLKMLNETPPVGVEALLKQANYSGEITEETVGFIIGPRLNAVGRLDDARIAAELLQMTEHEEASWMAEQVDSYNIERKAIVESITKEALIEAEEKISNGNRFLVLAKENWNEGVLGIVASKIVEKYHLPTIVLNIDYVNDYAKGSARSIEQISMYDSLQHAQEWILKFGGHHMAAGMTLPIDNIEQLERSVNAYLDEVLQDEMITSIVNIDAILEPEEITVTNISDMEKLRPFGTDFISPVIALYHQTINEIKQIGQEGAHLKFKTTDNLNCLMWQNGMLSNEFPPGSVVNIAGTLQLNEWNGNVAPQMVVSEIQSENTKMVDFRNVHPNKFAFLKDETVAYIIHPNQTKRNENYFYYGESVFGHDKIVFRDIPDSFENFKKTFDAMDADTVYFIFHKKNQIYFEGMPDMDRFKLLFKCFKMKPVIDLETDGGYLIDLLKVKPETLIFMLDVYKELQFIFQHEMTYTLNHSPEKREIQSAPSYQKRLDALQLEKFFLFSTFDHFKSQLQ